MFASCNKACTLTIRNIISSVLSFRLTDKVQGYTIEETIARSGCVHSRHELEIKAPTKQQIIN